MIKYILGVIGLILIFGIVFGITKRKQAQPVITSSQTKTVTGYQGALLAGTKSPYLAFIKSDYDKALADNKIVFLDFYANWCPICRAETPVLEQGFNALTSDKIVGFRVNFNDSDTDNDEKSLAKQFNVPYQHYKIILKGGKIVLTDPDHWDSQIFNDKINSLL